MGKIDLTINKTGLQHNIEKAKENNVIIPTIAQMQHPETIPEKIQEKLKTVGLWDVNPLNLFRITWKNEAKETGGLYQAVPNYVEIPSELSGVPCRILAMAGKWFPTGCHKVGASFGCLAPRLVTGQFDATYHHAVWPSTGNYCRGGAFNSKLLAVDSVAILPAEMSKERFEWLSKIAGQVIATPGCESNVKEIFDKTWELKQDPSMMIFNQFEEMGNPLWHYNVTGYALADLFEAVKKPGQRLAGACFTSGSAGTMSAGDLLKERYPDMKLGVGEALQCPTILNNGFGGHRIEGIGDKHIPWIHNVKNTDMAIAIDDEDSQRLLRLFNTAEGKKYLKEELKLSDELIEKLTWLGISGIANVLCCIKMAKYYELTENDVVGTVLTDSAVMYQSRIDELNQLHGAYNAHEAAMDHARHMLDLKTDSMLELTYTERKRVHNLKYYTWVEQQGMNVEDLNAQWYDTKNTWDAVHAQAKELDAARRGGYARVRIDGNMYDLDEEIKLEKNIKHTVEIVVDRLSINDTVRGRLADSIETAVALTGGLVIIDVIGGEPMEFSQNYACPEHGVSIDELSPRMFSFNNPFGACETCTGLGTFMKVDPARVIPDPHKSIRESAIKASGWYYAEGSVAEMYYLGLGKKYGFTLDTPIKDMSTEASTPCSTVPTAKRSRCTAPTSSAAGCTTTPLRASSRTLSAASARPTASG